MKILVTAFEPFGHEDDNPTLKIISALKEVDILPLPVSFTNTPKIALQEIKKIKPDAIILLGQAGGRAAISLERVAINLIDAKIPDNDGFAPAATPICENGDPAYFCKLPLGMLCDLIRQNGVPCHISNSAGTYVCNALYYSVMQAYPDLLTVFIHVPYSPSQAVDKKSTTPSMNVTDMISAVSVVIKFLKAMN